MKKQITWPNRPVFFRHPIPNPCLFKTFILRSPVQSVSFGKPAIERWSFSTLRARNQEVVLVCLRIGHTQLTHRHLMTHSDPFHCPSCHTSLSLVHFLVDCPDTLHSAVLRFLLCNLIFTLIVSLSFSPSPQLSTVTLSLPS